MSNPEDGRSTEQKVAIIRQIIPELFQQPNFLSNYILKGKKITISPNTQNLSFTVFESDSPISKKCEFSYDGKLSLNEGIDQEPNIKPKWIFSAKFKIGSILFEEKTELEIAFIGDRKENNQHSPTDRIFIHDNEENQSMLIDFKNNKIGLGDKVKRGGSSINRYKNQFSFDEIKNISDIKNFQYNEESKLVTITLKNGEEFILPISLTYNPNINNLLFEAEPFNKNVQPINTPSILVPIETTPSKSKAIKINFVSIKVSGRNENPTLEIENNLKVTFDQLLLLYYYFKKNYSSINIPKFIPSIKPKSITHIFEEIKWNNTKIWKNEGQTDPDPIISIFNEAQKLGFMDEKVLMTLIDQLKERPYSTT